MKRPGLRCRPKPARRPGRLLRGRSTTDRSSGVSLRLDQCHRPSELALRRAIRFSVGFPGCPARPSDRSSALPGCPARSDRTARPPRPGFPLRRARPPRRRLPGCPVPRLRTLMPLRRRRLPVARSSTPSPRPPARPPRLPGSSSPAPHRLPREGSSVRIRIFLHQSRFRLVNPVGPSDPSTAIAGRFVHRHRSSGSGWRALTGTEHTLQQVFCLVKREFSCPQGYPPAFVVPHRTNLFIHRSRTGCAQAVD